MNNPFDALPATPAHPKQPASALRVGAILLAAGESARMGRAKQLLPVGGKPLIVRMTECLLATDAWPIVVVLGSHADAIRPALVRLPVLIVENPAWAEGMASSLRAGIATLQQFSRAIDAALVTLCDQPALTPEMIRQMLALQSATGRTIVAAEYAGRMGAPALFLRTHFSALASLTGEEGARALLNGHPDRVASVSLPELAADLDTPADYAAWTQPN